MLITVSGIDGSGKSTLATELENELTLENYKVKMLEFPCSKSWMMLELLKKKGDYFEKYGNNSTSVGMALNLERLSFIYDVVIPSLEIYDYVILQRYLLDFAAIGMTQKATEQDLFFVKDMNSILPLGISFFVDTPQEIAYRRIIQRGVSCDIREQYDFHKHLYENYQCLVNQNEFNIYRLNGEMSVADITQTALSVIKGTDL